MGNLTLIHSNLHNSRQRWRWAPELNGEQPQRPSTMMMGQPTAYTKPTLQAEDNDEDKHQGLIITKSSTHYDDGNDPAPSQAVDYRSWVNALNDWRQYSHQRNRPMPRRNHPTSPPPYMKPLSYNADKFLNVGAIWGVASGYGCMVLVLRWCGFPGTCTVQYSPENTGCGVRLRVRYMRVSGTNPDGECTLVIFICRRDEAKLIESWRWGLLSHCTILRRFVKRLLQT